MENFGRLYKERSTGSLLQLYRYQFKKYLNKTDNARLKQHYVNKTDRVYQFGERDALAKECFTENFLIQKLEYIHKNPCAPH
ncbi:MAG: hypothetical protein C4308_02770 [Chitinophagaceae bacterium]